MSRCTTAVIGVMVEVQKKDRGDKSTAADGTGLSHTLLGVKMKRREEGGKLAMVRGGRGQGYCVRMGVSLF